MRNTLREKRKMLRYTQDQMSRMLGISRPHYTKIESGQRTPSFELSKKIKKIVCYDKDDLFDIFNSE